MASIKTSRILLWLIFLIAPGAVFAPKDLSEGFIPIGSRREVMGSPITTSPDWRRLSHDKYLRPDSRASGRSTAAPDPAIGSLLFQMQFNEWLVGLDPRFSYQVLRMELRNKLPEMLGKDRHARWNKDYDSATEFEALTSNFLPGGQTFSLPPGLEQILS